MWTEGMKSFVTRLVYKYHNELIEKGYNLRRIRQVKFGRSARTYGTCTIHNIDGSCTITISEVCFYSGEGSLKNTILHELTHSIKGCEGHGRLWQKCAKEIGNIYGIKIQQFATKEENIACKEYKESKYNWSVTCTSCGCETKSIRKTKLVSDVLAGKKNWKCNHCGSHDFKVKHLKKSIYVAR